MTNFHGSIHGIYETHLTVSDLSRSVTFYRDVLGLELAREIPERNVAFFWAGSKDSGMLGLWGIGGAPLRMGLHFAFRADLDAVLAACDRLTTAGVEPLGFHGEPIVEPVVLGWMPAASVYFRDPDGHSIEFLAMLDQPTDVNFGTGPYSRWLSRD